MHTSHPKIIIIKGSWLEVMNNKLTKHTIWCCEKSWNIHLSHYNTISSLFSTDIFVGWNIFIILVNLIPVANIDIPIAYIDNCSYGVDHVRWARLYKKALSPCFKSTPSAETCLHVDTF